MPRFIQNTVSRVWPVYLLLAVIVTPFIVRKTYLELKASDGKPKRK
jgi:hypothetical protein